MLRGYAHDLSPHPYWLPQLNAERFLFGRPIPTVRLQELLWDWHVRWYDAFLIDINRIHFIVPPTLGFVFWLRNRYLFFRYALTFIVISYAGALTFLLFPAAPPWAASQRHLIPPVVRITDFQHAAAAVPTGVGPLYGLLHRNPYAAIPSLHGGYSFLVFLFVVAAFWRSRWRWPVFVLAALYPAAQGFSVVYTANHYIVDLLIGYAYAAAAFFGVRALWRWRGWPEA
jgi:membrane-associated phospholipid phosphatase